MFQPTGRATWLHLSDIHVGMSNQGWLWPILKHEFFNDLKNLHSTEGPWDLVIFSGDLTQKGTPEEFGKLSSILSELWSLFISLDFNPKLFVIPGNHDLIRPNHLKPETMVLKDWWGHPEIHDFFWEPKSQYREFINETFNNYKSWKQNLSQLGIPSLDETNGIIQGDSSAVFEANGLRLGLIGLNSAWLQLTNENYEGKLHIDTRQILNVTQDDPIKWCAQNNFNLLITHHPVNWLAKTSQTSFIENINPPGRFTAHLYGHMHEPNHIKLSSGGSKSKREIQAASLFGLEKILPEGIDRTHGYSLNRITVAGSDTEIFFWPRRDRVVVGGKRIIGQDYNFELTKEQYIKDTLTLELIEKPKNNTPILTQPTTGLKDLELSSTETLDSIKMVLNPAPAHLNVRSVQIATAMTSLAEHRCFWLVSEWGMGVEGFLWSLKEKRGTKPATFYQLDMDKFTNLLSFYDEIKESTGFTLEKICASLSGEVLPHLVLSDIPVSAAWLQSQTEELLKLVKILLEYCPSLSIIMRARISPQNGKFPIAELKPLDLPDTKNYIEKHSFGGEKYSDYDAVTKIYRYTDGIPNAIDSALRDLNVTPLSNLPSISSDVAGKNVIVNPGDEALKKIIRELGESKDPILQRSYDMLKTLTIFPQGEQLERLKYFNSKQPYFPSYAHELISRGLVDSLETEGLDLAKKTDITKTLIANRVVREIIITRINPAQFKELNRKAASLYFGPNWHTGIFKPPRTLKFDTPGRSASEIINAGIIIQRIAVEAVSSANNKKIAEALALLNSHGAALKRGSYYKAAVELFQDTLPTLSDCVDELQLALTNCIYSSCLRMLEGNEASERARDIILQVPFEHLDKDVKIDGMLTLCLCYDSLGEISEAVDLAKKIIKLYPKSNAALQARWVVLENDTENPLREKEIFELENLARKRKAYIVANNIALSKAKEHKDPAQQRDAYEQIISSSLANGHTYSAIRGIIQASQTDGYKFAPTDKARLITAYHYLYNEGSVNLFTKCHNSLWKIFESEGDIHNLLQLFKYSSLVWRLRDKEHEENLALTRLQQFISNNLFELIASNQVMAYYIVRSSTLNQD